MELEEFNLDDKTKAKLVYEIDLKTKNLQSKLINYRVEDEQHTNKDFNESFKKSFYVMDKVKNILELNKTKVPNSVQDFLSWTSEKNCSDYCFKLDVPADGSYTLKIWGSGVTEPKINVSLLSTSTKEKTFSEAINKEDGYFYSDSEIYMEKGTYLVNLLFPNEKNLLEVSGDWREFKPEDFKVTKDSLVFTKNSLLNDNLKDDTNSINLEELVLNQSWGYVYKEINDWEPAQSYRVGITYRSNKANLGLAIVEYPLEGTKLLPNIISSQQVESSYDLDSEDTCEKLDECMSRYSKTVRSSGIKSKALLVLYSTAPINKSSAIKITSSSVTNVRNPVFLAYNFKKEDKGEENGLVVKKTSPIKYVVEGAKEGDLLLLNQSFDPGWELYIPKDREGWFWQRVRSASTKVMEFGLHLGIPDSAIEIFAIDTIGKINNMPRNQHVIANGYANAWIIPSIESGESFEIKYMKQRHLALSILSLFLIIPYLFLYLILKRKNI